MNELPPVSRTSERAALAAALAKVAQGDRSAFAQLYRRTSAKLFGICLRILGDRSEAEDVLQESYVNVWQRAGAFDPGRASPVTWLAAIARNKAIDRLRSRGSRPTQAIEGEALVIADPAPSASERLELSEETRRLTRCIDDLEAKQANAIRTAFFAGLTYSELAERDNVPLGTMKSWVRRGLLRLKECLER